MRTPSLRTSPFLFALTVASVVVAAAVGAPSCACGCPPTLAADAPCTPESAGFHSSDAVTIEGFAPPDGCFLVDERGGNVDRPPVAAVTASITNEDDAEALYECGGIDAGAKPPSGIDFTHKQIVVVSGSGFSDLPTDWEVHDAHGFHIGVTVAGCSGARPGLVRDVFVVDQGETMSVFECPRACGACGPFASELP